MFQKVAIANVCNGTRNSANGFYWIRTKDYHEGIKLPIDKGNNGTRRNPVLVIDKKYKNRHGI